ncbi:MAG: glycosyltransferase [Treponema sp.]|jgi:glycosyltransferase involved in cell wall biosynthesis|nr:glycosyltransferase [Treponema sp.]
MKIVMFTDAYWPRVNGVTVSVDSFSHALIRAGHEVMIICSFYPESAEGSRHGRKGEVEKAGDREPFILRVASMPLPLPVSKEDRLAKFTQWFRVSKRIEEFGPDILHIHSEFVMAEFGYFYARLHNLPAVYTLHTNWADYGPSYFPWAPKFLLGFLARLVHRPAMRRADVIIVPTVRMRELLRRYKVKVPSVQLYTGIDPVVFHYNREEAQKFRTDMEEEYPLLRGKRILLYAGRVTAEKNVGFLVRILPTIVRRHPDTALLMAGNGPDLDEFQEECGRMGLSEHCVFTGYLDRKVLALTYGFSDIFVFPSLTETQGLVTIEAMLSGTPVVAIGEMGTAEVMNGDNGGFMVKNDPVEFTRRVCELLEDKELYRRKAAEAREYAQGWTIDVMTAKLEGIYRDTIASYREKYGMPKVPLWELITDRRWWKANNRKFWKMTVKRWRKITDIWRPITDIWKPQ